MRKFIINVNGESHEVEVEEVGAKHPLPPFQHPAPAPPPLRLLSLAPPDTGCGSRRRHLGHPAPAPAASPSGAETVSAPMPGNIVAA